MFTSFFLAAGCRRKKVRKEVFVRLNRVFREVFNHGNIEVTDRAMASNIEGRDSLMHITLISAVEDEFDMKFNMKDVEKMADIITRELEE